MGTQDFYFKTDSYEVENLLKNGIFNNYFKTKREYGFALYLGANTNMDLNFGRSLVIRIKMRDLSNILIVNNFQDLLANYLVAFDTSVTWYVNNNGITDRIGTKFVEPFIADGGYNGLWITEENTLVLYNNKNIRKIELNT